MRSISLLLYKDGKLEEIARDFGGAWMSAVESIDEETFIGSDYNCNLFTVKRNSGAATEDERSRLTQNAVFHLGEQINSIVPGSLVMKAAESEGLSVSTYIYGTISGSIGVIGCLNQDHYNRMEKIQQQAAKMINGVGGFKHNEWRSFKDKNRKTIECRNFLDGDLIESFLDLPPSRLAEAAKSLDMSNEDLCREIETLQRAIH